MDQPSGEDHLPPPARPRRTSRLERMALGYMVGGCAVVQVLGISGIAGPYMPAAFAFVIASGMAMYFSGWQRRRRALLEHDLRICPRCLQILRGLPDEGICPECGSPYEIQEIRRTWEREYPSLKARSTWVS